MKLSEMKADSLLRSTVGPGLAMVKSALLASVEKAPVTLVARTSTRACIVQKLPTVQTNSRTAGPSAGWVGFTAVIGMGKVAPLSVDRKRSKPLTCAASASGTVQVMVNVEAGLSTSPPLGAVRVTPMPASLIEKLASLASWPVAPDVSVATMRMRAVVVFNPVGTFQVKLRASPAMGLGLILVLKVVPPSVDRKMSKWSIVLSPFGSEAVHVI